MDSASNSFILGIETSCDDTSVALVNLQGTVSSCLWAKQDLDHAPFGGVVPEIASRNHTCHLLPLIDKALKQSQVSWNQIRALAVTQGPGLVGSLIVGLVTAQTLALLFKKPLIGIHHIEGHIVAPFLKDPAYKGPDFYSSPFVALTVSGGHTQLYYVEKFGDYHLLGQSIDDAAGEAFDKFAQMMGLPYPGGVLVDQWAQKGNDGEFEFPRPLLREKNMNFSFSGLKSSARRKLQTLSHKQIQSMGGSLCASYQKAIIDILENRLRKAIEETRVRHFIVTGGVSANSSLRTVVKKIAQEKNMDVAIPPPSYCTDNGAMIGLAGLFHLNEKKSRGGNIPLKSIKDHKTPLAPRPRWTLCET